MQLQVVLSLGLRRKGRGGLNSHFCAIIGEYNRWNTFCFTRTSQNLQELHIYVLLYILTQLQVVLSRGSKRQGKGDLNRYLWTIIRGYNG
jgi:hypothetical protein